MTHKPTMNRIEASHLVIDRAQEG